jgi:hypothetical protein
LLFRVTQSGCFDQQRQAGEITEDNPFESRDRFWENHILRFIFLAFLQATFNPMPYFSRSGRSDFLKTDFLKNVVIFADGSVTWTSECSEPAVSQPLPQPKSMTRSASSLATPKQIVTITTTVQISAV